MKIDLAVIGQGAVSPAGVGVDALFHGKPVPVDVATLGQPEKVWPVLRVDQKDPAFNRWQREPRLRRASPITFFLVEAAEQTLAGLSAAERAETGLIVAFSAGCLAYSRRFFEGVLKQGQHTASPALFPETVFNSPVSHVATVLGLNGAAYALVGDESAWVGALQTASVWLQMKRVKQVVVLGVEEFDPVVLDAYSSVRWLRRQNSTHGFLTSEGAAGVLVSQGVPERPRMITAGDGWIYRTPGQAACAAEKLLNETDPKVPIYPTAQHNWLGPIEQASTLKRSLIATDDQPYLGEAFTASAAWNTLRALGKLFPERPHLLIPVWGLNHQLAFLQLGNGNS